MAMLLFKGKTLTVKVTHNVISELIRLTDTNYQDAVNLSHKDPYGWMRDVVYCSLRIYAPSELGDMNKFQVGDELFKLSSEDLMKLLTDLLDDFVKATGIKKEAASEKE